MKFFLLFALLIAGTPLVGHASETSLSDATYLRKLSFHLRGLPPDPREYTELEQTRSPEGKSLFFDRKIKEYLGTENHASRMVFRLAERFRLKTPSSHDLSDPYRSNRFENMDESLTNLFRRMAEDNLSWDALLTGKDYVLRIQEDATSSNINDFDFFRALRPDLPPANQGFLDGPVVQTAPNLPAPLKISFQENDPRIAGALTTARFLSRYNTTALNKNRKRAAAVFDIFLCDPMVPAIESTKDRKHEFLDSTFAEQFEVTAQDLKSLQSDEARHGSDSQCMSCHSKLDPMGKMFQGHGLYLNPKAYSGALFYRRSSTEFVNIPTRGLGEMAKILVQQPEYVDCQVRWFWEQFIGKDRPLTDKRKNELVADFNRVQRRTNDFISLLVKAPEFRTKPGSTPVQRVSFDRVQPILKRCDSCHMMEGYIPDFSRIPFGFSRKPEEHVKWLHEITRRLSLPKEDKDSMPRDRKSWSDKDLELLKAWIQGGAPDANGNPTLQRSAP